MGENPRTIERHGVAELRAIFGEEFHVTSGHEQRADIFVTPKQSRQEREPAPGSHWLALQIKITSSRTGDWDRKMRFLLRHKQDQLHGVVLFGFSLVPEEKAFITLVHRHRCYDGVDISEASLNCDRDQVCHRLKRLFEESEAQLLASPARALVYSNATLVEADARADFLGLITGTGITYEPAREEYGAIDGFLFLDRKPSVRFRIQEKALSVRRQRGQALCLRCNLRG